MLFQAHIEFNGILGAVIGFILFLSLFCGAVYGIWRWPGKYVWDRLREGPASRRERAFARFQREWILDHMTAPVFIMDEKKRCIWASESLTRMLDIDSLDLMGRGWHRIVKESDLSRVLTKWNEAYDHQSPYVNISTLMVGSKEVRFKISAEPFIWANKVRNYLGTLEEME